VQGRVGEAKERLGEAIKLDADVKLMALVDPDLESIW